MFPRNCYSIAASTAKSDQSLAPTFSVTIKHSTLALPDAEKYTSNTKSGFTFSILDNSTLRISITPQKPYDEIDKLFRCACAMLTRYKLTTRECCEIIQAYETHLSRHGVDSEYSPKKSLPSSCRVNYNSTF
jgi:hypothetical protein